MAQASAIGLLLYRLNTEVAKHISGVDVAFESESSRLGISLCLEACAYELTLHADCLTELARLAEQMAADLPQWCANFGEKVRAEQGWECWQRQKLKLKRAKAEKLKY